MGIGGNVDKCWKSKNSWYKKYFFSLKRKWNITRMHFCAIHQTRNVRNSFISWFAFWMNYTLTVTLLQSCFKAVLHFLNSNTISIQLCDLTCLRVQFNVTTCSSCGVCFWSIFRSVRCVQLGCGWIRRHYSRIWEAWRSTNWEVLCRAQRVPHIPSLLALQTGLWVLLCYADSSLPMVLWVDFKPLISQGALAGESTVLWFQLRWPASFSEHGDKRCWK